LSPWASYGRGQQWLRPIIIITGTMLIMPVTAAPPTRGGIGTITDTSTTAAAGPMRTGDRPLGAAGFCGN
jgi:hypothetical protein